MFFFIKESERRRLDLDTNAPTVLRWVDSRVDEAFVDTKKTEIEACACAASGKRACHGEFMVLSGGDPNEEVVRRAHAGAVCSVLAEELREAAPGRDPSSRDLATTLRLARLLNAHGSMPVGEMTLTLPQILALLERVAQNGTVREELVRRKAGIEKDQQVVQSALKALGTTASGGWALWTRRFAEFFWPYLG